MFGINRVEKGTFFDNDGDNLSVIFQQFQVVLLTAKLSQKVCFMLTKITYENYKLRCSTVNSDIILIKSCGGFGENAANLPFNYCKHFLGISG